MEIEVGDYVRIKEKGIIGKIEQIGVSLFWLEDGSAFSIKEESYKHSKNIIDLIEAGDYVNGYRILEKTKIKNNDMQICILKDNNFSNWRTVNEKTLKSIVTKEQIASIEYKV